MSDTATTQTGVQVDLKGVDGYTLNISSRQASVLQEALDLYYRLLMGQTERVVEFYIMHRRDLTPDDCEEIRTAMRYVKEAAFHELDGNASHGIADGRIGPDAPIACDLYQVIRHQFAFDRLAPGEKVPCSPAYYEPRAVGEEALARIAKEVE